MTVRSDGGAVGRSGARASGPGAASAGRLCGEQPAHASGVKRLGDKPVVIEFASGGARIEVATRAGHRDQVTGPLTIGVT
jgi:hypothetical protein